MLLETALLLNFNYDAQITKPNITSLDKYEIVQEEKIDKETELLFIELFKVLDQESLQEMQKQKTN
jgi:hypothetical protein